VKTRVKVDPTPCEDRKYLKFIEIYRDLFGTLKDMYVRISS